MAIEPNLLVIGCAWPADTAVLNRAMGSVAVRARSVRVYASVDSSEAMVWAIVDPATAATVTCAVTQALSASGLEGLQLRLLQTPREWAGASAREEAPFRYVVETDVVPAAEADFNAWYDTEHAPGLASVPGTVHAARHVDVHPSGSPHYIAVYDLSRPETLGSPGWLAVRGTDWSARVRPEFRNTKRTMYRRVDIGG